MCPMCDCCEVAWAAPLGNLWHACCRACGWVFSFEQEECDANHSQQACAD
jgi:hypothetical protein